MHTLLSFFGVLARLLRPTRGTHTTAFGYLRELGFEARRNRSRRVRRYVEALTLSLPETAELSTPKAVEPAPPVSVTPPTPLPFVPAPRRPIEDAHRNGCPQVEIVRGPYRAWETHRDTLAGVGA